MPSFLLTWLVQIDVPKKVKKLVEDASKSQPQFQDISRPAHQELHVSRRTTAQSKGERLCHMTPQFPDLD